VVLWGAGRVDERSPEEAEPSPGACQYVALHSVALHSVALHSVALHSIELRDVELHRQLPWNRGDPDALRGAVVREEGGGEESMDSNHADGSLICLRKGRAK